jgi:hypothetical protein
MRSREEITRAVQVTWEIVNEVIPLPFAGSEEVTNGRIAIRSAAFGVVLAEIFRDGIGADPPAPNTVNRATSPSPIPPP